MGGASPGEPSAPDAEHLRDSCPIDESLRDYSRSVGKGHDGPFSIRDLE